MGILTMEDVIEQIIDDVILDETDIVDSSMKIKKSRYIARKSL